MLCALVPLACFLAPAASASVSVPVQIEMGGIRMHDGHAVLLRDRQRASRQARAAIVGGHLISIEQAPWQVVLESVIPIGPTEALRLRCGGAILDKTEVLTAAHCLIDPLTAEPVPAADMGVATGTSNFSLVEPTEQVFAVSQARIHPYYVYEAEGPDADDVAVLTLKGAIAIGTTAKSIALAAPGTVVPESTTVDLTGFGAEVGGERATGELHSIAMSTVFGRECGGEANALILCASTSSGSLCSGDSGSALTLPAAANAQLGVADFNLVSETPCSDGAIGGFANLAAPEIRDFIEGDDQPPRAPRGGGAVIEGVLVSGHSLSCYPGKWTNSPTFTYSFIDSAGTALQTGASPSYPLSSAEVGQSILCEVSASNAGGIGVGRTLPLGPIHASTQEEEAVKSEEAAASRKHSEEEEAASAAAKRRQEEEARVAVLGAKEGSPDARVASVSLRASRSGTVAIEVGCPAGVISCDGTVTVRTLSALLSSVAGVVKSKASVLTLASGSFDVPGGVVKTVSLHLSSKARVLLARVHTLRVRVTVTAHSPTGGAHTGQAVLTLRAPKSGHGKG